MKDYKQIFNERLNSQIKYIRFEELDIHYIKPYLVRALSNLSFFSLDISKAEYDEVVYKATCGRTSLTMPQAFNVLNILKLATPAQMGFNTAQLADYSKVVDDLSSMLTKWFELAAPYTEAVRNEVNAEAKDDAQKEQIRNKIKSGGHKGLAKQIAL